MFKLPSDRIIEFSNINYAGCGTYHIEYMIPECQKVNETKLEPEGATNIKLQK